MDEFEFEDIDDDEEESYNSKKMTIATTLGELVGEDTFADIYFIVGEGKEQRSIPAHRMILAANSDVFEAMLYPSLFDEKEQKQTPDEIPEIFINDVCPFAFRTMLRCVYSDNPDINADEFANVYYIAKKFQLEGLRLVCQDFLKIGITVDNVCVLYATTQKLKNVQTTALTFIVDQADAVFKTMGFQNLNTDCIKQILANDQLAIEEIAIFNALIKWSDAECQRQGIKNSSENKQHILKNIVPLVRFPVMQIENVANFVSPTGVLLNHQLLEIFTYLGLPEDKREEMKVSFSTKPREAVLKWVFCSSFKSNLITLENRTTASNESSDYAYCIGNAPMKKGKHCWQVNQTNSDGSWLLLGVSAKKKFLDDNNITNDHSLWGITSHSQQYRAGRASSMHVTLDFKTGPLQVLLDCDVGTLTIMNLMNKKKYLVPNLPKKKSGGFVPYFNLKNCSITVRPVSYKKFGEKI